MILDAMRGIEEARILPGANLTDQVEDWTKNYRCPDVVVFLPGNPAVDRETHWLGGPDFAIEVVSPGDRSRKKFPFYERVGVRELLLVERRPWRLELYRASEGKLELVGASRPTASEILKSDVVPISMRLVARSPRPRIEVTQTTRGESWLI
jgi:Uma2 family endonuclease